MADTWVFGYGSLVDPRSLARTIDRLAEIGVDAFQADLAGFGRRWNYGTLAVGESVDEPGREWRIVALGLEAAADESVNGLIARVDDDDLAALDRRERNYDRVDVTAAMTIAVDIDVGAVVTYVPRAEPVERFEQARADGTAAISKRYWDLVDNAFAALGPGQQERYRATTPDAGIPVVELHERFVPKTHRPDAD